MEKLPHQESITLNLEEEDYEDDEGFLEDFFEEDV